VGWQKRSKTAAAAAATVRARDGGNNASQIDAMDL